MSYVITFDIWQSLYYELISAHVLLVKIHQKFTHKSQPHYLQTNSVLKPNFLQND